MVIKKFAYLKSFSDRLQEQFDSDKKYQPIKKRMLALLRDFRPILKRMNDEAEKDRARLVESIEKRRENKEQYVESAQKSLVVLKEKNNGEIERRKQLNDQKRTSLESKIREQNKGLDERIAQANAHYDDQVHKAELEFKRKKVVIDKGVEAVRTAYRQAIQQIESEKGESDRRLLSSYEEKINRIENDLEETIKQAKDNRLEINARSEETTAENDEIYVRIKTAHSTLSVAINQKINELKKSYQKALKKYDKIHEKRMVPIQEQIDKLQEEFSRTKEDILKNYREQLSRLDEQFDQQREAYEEKKKRIVHRSGETITLLNSKLSAYRESINQIKTQTAREARLEMKKVESHADRDRLNRNLTRALNSYDNDLNKQILRTQKDILTQQKESQRDLFEHDLQHLRDVNEWRLKRSLAEYRKKQEFTKVDLNYNHNMKIYEHQMKLLEAYDRYEKDILSITYNLDILPLDTQLSIASSFQECELNLLANEASLAIAHYKFLQSHEDYLENRKTLEYDHQKKRAKKLFEADQQVLNISTQLQIEKEKLKRDYGIEEQTLRGEINQSLFDKSVLNDRFDLDQTLALIECDRKLYDHELHHALEKDEHSLREETSKREFVQQEAASKTRFLIDQEVAKTALKINRCEVESNQRALERYYEILRTIRQTEIRIKESLHELYLLPSHPEVFKNTLEIMSEMYDAFLETISKLTGERAENDQSFYHERFSALLDYTYGIRSRELDRMYDERKSSIETQRQTILHVIHNKENDVYRLQQKEESTRETLEQLTERNEDLKTLENPHKKDQLTIKENNRMALNLENELKQIQISLQALDRDINMLHGKLLPFNDRLEKLDLRRRRAHDVLSIKKQKESVRLENFQSDNRKTYQTLLKAFTENTRITKTAYARLSNELYVTDAFLDTSLKQIKDADDVLDRLITNSQQDHLDTLQAMHHDQIRQRKNMLDILKKSLDKRIEGLESYYRSNMKRHTRLLERLEKKHDNKRLSIKDTLNHELSKIEELFNKDRTQKHGFLEDKEQKIVEKSDRLRQEIGSLTDNQHAIAQQFTQDYEASIKELDDDYRKRIQQLDDEDKRLESEQQNLSESIENKNRLLLMRYETEQNKSRDNLEQKRSMYDTNESKTIQAKRHRQTHFEETVRRMKTRRENEIDNLESHLKRFNTQTRRAQTRMLRKETRILRKSHRFKMRMLKLN